MNKVRARIYVFIFSIMNYEKNVIYIIDNEFCCALLPPVKNSGSNPEFLITKFGLVAHTLNFFMVFIREGTKWDFKYKSVRKYCDFRSVF